METLQVIFILVSISGVYSTGCTAEEHRNMQEEFSNCRIKYNNNFHNSEKGKEDLCDLLDQIINICGQKWRLCHSKEEINRMKEMHTEAFIQHWQRGSNIEDCPMVISFRESLLNKELDPAGGCSDEDSINGMNRFQTCSHSISTEVYNRIIDHSVSQLIVEAMCQGLQNISSQCPVLLQTCHAPEDIQQIKELHLAEMKKFFYRIGKDRIEEKSLDDCSQVESTVESSTEKHTVSEIVTKPPVTLNEEISSEASSITTVTDSPALEKEIVTEKNPEEAKEEVFTEPTLVETDEEIEAESTHEHPEAPVHYEDITEIPDEDQTEFDLTEGWIIEDKFGNIKRNLDDETEYSTVKPQPYETKSEKLGTNSSSNLKVLSIYLVLLRYVLMN